MSATTGSEETGMAASPRQWLGLVVVYLSIPFALFASASTLDSWQGWLYAALLLAAGIGGRVWAERRHPGLMAERQSAESARNAKAWDKVLAPLMAISIGHPMVIVAGLDHRFGGSPTFPPWLNGIGFVMISLGYAVTVWTLVPGLY